MRVIARDKAGSLGTIAWIRRLRLAGSHVRIAPCLPPW
jgi:hypothetical protein